MVLVAKEFIDGELAKYKTWGASNEFIRSIVGDEQAWFKLKATGAGQSRIREYRLPAAVIFRKSRAA